MMMKRSAILSLFVVVGMSASCLAQAEPARPKKSTLRPAAPAQPATPANPEHKQPAGQPEMEAMMQAYAKAATPGKEHEVLTKGAGVWDGKIKHWMEPNATPIESTCITTITPVLDGRFIRCETVGDMPGMGTFTGLGLYGYDNVAKEYQMNWVDSMGTGMARGTGELSDDGKTMTWTMSFMCPITNAPMTMREVQKFVDENHTVMEMYGTGPGGGEEFKMMEIASTRRPGSANRPTAATPAGGSRPTLRGTDEPRR